MGQLWSLGPLRNVLIVWRRLSFFEIHWLISALLGVILSVSFDINISLSIFTVSSLVALLLIRLQKATYLANDALLGLPVSFFFMAIGLVVLGFLSFIRFDIMGVLFWRYTFRKYK